MKDTKNLKHQPEQGAVDGERKQVNSAENCPHTIVCFLLVDAWETDCSEFFQRSILTQW